MKIEDIIWRESPSTYQQDEVEFVVEEYIKDMTGKQVDINMRHSITEAYYMNLTFDIAIEYFRNKNDEKH